MQLVDPQSVACLRSKRIKSNKRTKSPLYRCRFYWFTHYNNKTKIRLLFIIDCRLSRCTGCCARRVRPQTHTNSDYLDFPNFNLFKTNVYLLMPNGWMDEWSGEWVIFEYSIQFGIAMWTTYIDLSSGLVSSRLVADITGMPELEQWTTFFFIDSHFDA